MKILGMIITVFAIFFAIKIAKKILKIVFSLLSLFGIAMYLYGDQIIAWIQTLIATKM